MILETRRLRIRPFVMDDLLTIHRILDETFGDGSKVDDRSAVQERRSWLQWSILSQEWFAKLHQAPYGDRAISLKRSGQVIGSIGYAPLLMPVARISELGPASQPSECYTPEFGLFWVIDPKHQRQGYATEAATKMIDYAFKQSHVKRVLATTEYVNEASQNVMQKIGMKIARNPLKEPTWLQVVGVLQNTLR